MINFFRYSSNQFIDQWYPYRYPLIDASMRELLTTGFMSNRGRQVIQVARRKICPNLWTASFISQNPFLNTVNNLDTSNMIFFLTFKQLRLYVPFLFVIWALTGEWEQNGLRHAFWITIHVPIMVIGHMEQVFDYFLNNQCIRIIYFMLYISPKIRNNCLHEGALFTTNILFSSANGFMTEFYRSCHQAWLFLISQCKWGKKITTKLDSPFVFLKPLFPLFPSRGLLVFISTI